MLTLALMIGTLSAQPDAKFLSFEPCRWWTLDFEIGDYVCTSVGVRESVPTSQQFETTVQALNERIAELEARLAQMEEKSPR